MESSLCIATEYYEVYEVIDKNLNIALYLIAKTRSFFSIQTTLRYKLNQAKNFSDQELFKWIKDILDGIEFLHGKNIIHRDIRPE